MISTNKKPEARTSGSTKRNDKNPMTTNEQPVKPAMTDAETEAMIAEYLGRKLAKVQARTKLYCKIDATLTSIPEYGTRFEFGSYISDSDYHSAGTADASVDKTLASIGDVRVAARLREEAAAKLKQAEQIEAAAMEGEVAK